MASRFAALVFVLSGLADLPGRFKIGSAVTIVLLVACWIPLGLRWKELKQSWRIAGPLLIFILWVAVSFIWHRPSMSGLENVAILILVLGLLLKGTSNERPAYKLSGVIAVTTGVAGITYMISLFMDGPGSSTIFGARIFALCALLGVAWYVAQFWTGLRGAGLAVLLLCLVALSLSRMALAIGIIQFPLAGFMYGLKGLRRRATLVSLVVLPIIVIASSKFSPLTDRFIAEPQASSSLAIGDVDLDTSGRLVMWAVIWQSYLESPWIGNGAGSAADLLEGNLSGISHPHCDYLLVLHDYGAIGLGIFLFAMGNLIYRVWRAWRPLRTTQSEMGSVALATMLFLLSIVFAMATDNCLSYAYLMAPLALLISTTTQNSGQISGAVI